MAVAFGAAGAASSVVGGNATPGLPAGLAAGQLMVLLDVAWSSSLGTPTTPGTPAGWQLKTSYVANAVRFSWFYRAWQSGDAAPTVSGGASPDEHQAKIISLTGASTTGDPTDVITAGNTYASSSSGIGPITGLTTVTPGGIVLVAGARQNDQTDGTAIDTLTGDGLTWVELTDYGGASGQNWGMAWDYALTPSALTVTAKTFNLPSNTVAAVGAGQMWAIVPAVTTRPLPLRRPLGIAALSASTY